LPHTKKLLITGFGPFDGRATNASWEMAKQFDHKRFGDWEIVAGLVEPVAYDVAATAAKRFLRKLHPQAVIALGEAKIRRPQLERYAHNLRDATAPDTTGVSFTDGRLIDREEPHALRTALPLEALREELAAAGHRIVVSSSAGGYICNEVFFALLQWQNRSGRPAGFVHLPVMETAGGLARRDLSWDRLTETFGALLAATARHLA
jgi:pyroglutamyl-peptidase